MKYVSAEKLHDIWEDCLGVALDIAVVYRRGTDTETCKITGRN